MRKAIDCPACGFYAQQEFDTCPKCGVIVEKYFARQLERAKRETEKEQARIKQAEQVKIAAENKAKADSTRGADVTALLPATVSMIRAVRGQLRFIRSKKALKVMSMLLPFILCFVGRPCVVVLPELTGRVVHSNTASSGDGSGRLLYVRNEPITNTPVFLNTAINRTAWFYISDGPAPTSIASKIGYYTYSDDRGNIRIPRIVLIRFAFGTFLEEIHLDKVVKVVVLSPTDDAGLADSNLPPQDPYHVYSPIDQAHFYHEFKTGAYVKPLTLRDLSRYEKDNGSIPRWAWIRSMGPINLWRRYEAWIRSKTTDRWLDQL